MLYSEVINLVIRNRNRKLLAITMPVLAEKAVFSQKCVEEKWSDEAIYFPVITSKYLQTWAIACTACARLLLSDWLVRLSLRGERRMGCQGIGVDLSF